MQRSGGPRMGGAVLAGGVLMLSQAAVGATFNITGATAKNENYCSGAGPIFLQEDCTYNAAYSGDGFYWSGPYGGNGYYAADPGIVDLPGTVQNRSGIPLTGTLDITGSGASAQVSMSFTMSAMYRKYLASISSWATESWDSITHTIVATTVTSAVANGGGGFDYTLGVVPNVIFNTVAQGGLGQDFPANIGADVGAFDSPWQAPGTAGIAPIEGNSSGVASTATVNGYACAGSACGTALAWNTNAKAAFEQILLRISTDSNGDVTGGFAFLVNTADVFNEDFYGAVAAGNESWNATTMAFTASAAVVPVPAAVWLFASALGLVGLARRRGR